MKGSLKKISILSFLVLLTSGAFAQTDPKIKLTCQSPNAKVAAKALALAGKQIVIAACPTCSGVSVKVKIKPASKPAKQEFLLSQVIDSSILSYTQPVLPTPTATAQATATSNSTAQALSVAAAGLDGGKLSILEGTTIALPSATCEVSNSVSITVKYKQLDGKHQSTWNGTVKLVGALK